MRNGRPSLLTDELTAQLCERITRGEPMARICDDEAMPAYGTIWRWENENAEFRELLTRARRYGTHHIADDCIKIADDDQIEAADKRVRIDTRLRLIGKWNAKEFGDKLALEHSADDSLRAWMANRDG